VEKVRTRDIVLESSDRLRLSPYKKRLNTTRTAYGASDTVNSLTGSYSLLFDRNDCLPDLFEEREEYYRNSFPEREFARRMERWENFVPVVDVGSETTLYRPRFKKHKGKMVRVTDYEDLEELYERLVGQWADELGHVVTVVGGVYRHTKYGGQEGVVHKPVPRDEQEEALEFLLENAFRTPDYLIDAEVLRRIEATGTVDRIREEQTDLLDDLLQDDRLGRLVEAEAVRSGDPYPLADMLEDLREGIWEELDEGSVRVDPYRRNLQRAWVETMADKLDGRSDLRALSRGELREASDRIVDRIDRSADRVTRLHLMDVRDRIEDILEEPMAEPEGEG
jgi:hypothetical protein